MNAALTALVNGLIVSAFMAATLWFVMALLAKRTWNAATRYIVWWAALLITIAVPLLYTSARPDSSYREKGDVRPVVARGTRSGANNDRKIELPNVTTSSLRADAGRLEPKTSTTKADPRSGVLKPLLPIQIASGPWAEWFLVLWMIASSFMLLRLTVSYILLERRKARAESAPAYQTRLDEWLARCRAGRRRIRLGVSKDISTPIAAGPYRPSILIPHRIMEELSDDELNQVGLHEAAHFSRYDDFALILQRVIQAVFVFHPVVHWIARRIDLEREIACDDFVVDLTGNPRPYALCLTRVVELANEVHLQGPAVAAAQRRSHLETRVEVLLDSSRDTRTSLLKLRLTGAVVALCFILGIAGAMPSLFLFATTTAARTPQPALIQIPVVVTDALGRYVSGLQKEHFKVFENGVERTVADISSNQAISVAFVYEVQDGRFGSDVLQQTIDGFKTTAIPDDEFWTIYSFNGQVETSSGLQNTGEILNRLKSTQAEPVPLADELRQALGVLKTSRNTQRVIVVLSDGDEHFHPVLPQLRPSLDRPEAYLAGARAGQSMATVGMASEADAKIYAVSLSPLYPPPLSILGAAAGPALLDEIAESTGGRHVAIANAAETQRVITRMAVEMRNSYSVQYRRENVVQSEKNIEVRVEIFPPRGIRALYAHARPAYVVANQTGAFSTIDGAALQSQQPLNADVSNSTAVIISETEGLDFTSYLNALTDRVRSNWFPRIPAAAKQGEKGGVQVTFTIRRDGSIQAARVSKGSGVVSLDQASLESIQASAPFPTLPQEFKQDRIVVQLSFFYNLK